MIQTILDLTSSLSKSELVDEHGWKTKGEAMNQNLPDVTDAFNDLLS